jgi:hypothetical protein
MTSQGKCFSLKGQNLISGWQHAARRLSWAAGAICTVKVRNDSQIILYAL